jgi:sulfatase modifying factor 1
MKNAGCLALMMLVACATSKEATPSAKHNCKENECPRPRKEEQVQTPQIQSSVVIESHFTIETEKKNCPSEMVLVEGEFCPEVREECDKWLDPPGTKFARCKKFKPSVCISKQRVHKRFCIDTDEYTEQGETLPKANVSWEQAKAICEGHGKQLCSESNWTYACEKGENDTIHAYTTGLERPSDVCNFDLIDLLNAQGKLKDFRKPVSELLKCVNPTTGVRNMNGNMDEWTIRDLNGGPYKSALKGNWWMGARSRCRPATVDHSETNYWSISVGFRCCSETKDK